jgi:hypothetical protein
MAIQVNVKETINDLLFSVLANELDGTYKNLNTLVHLIPSRFNGVQIPITRMMPDAVKRSEWDRMADLALTLHHLNLNLDDPADALLFENNVATLEEMEQVLVKGL